MPGRRSAGSPPTWPRPTPSQRLARVVGRWITVLPMMDPGEMTVSEEDAQFLRHRVFCDLRM
ncbi:hypothetical protein DLJ57_04820, partial [Micromonospora chalcea]